MQHELVIFYKRYTALATFSSWYSNIWIGPRFVTNLESEKPRKHGQVDMLENQ